MHERLISLPRNREEAWKALQDLRSTAREATSARAVEAVFQTRYRLRLEDLVVLFENPGWRHSARGGNRWAYITRALIDLRDAIERQDVETVSDLLGRIPNMPHNTPGDVASKLRDLDDRVQRT